MDRAEFVFQIDVIAVIGAAVNVRYSKVGIHPVASEMARNVVSNHAAVFADIKSGRDRCRGVPRRSLCGAVHACEQYGPYRKVRTKGLTKRGAIKGKNEHIK